MKKILFLVSLLFIFPNVYALEYNVTNSITSPVSPSGPGTYTGEEQNGTTSSWNVNTRYQGTLQRIRFNIPVPSSVGECYWTNLTYKITMNMATEDWRNRFGTVKVLPYSSSSTNWSNGKVTFVSTKKIYFTFKIPSSDTSCNQFVYVDLPSNALFTPFTGETNWNLKSIILSDDLTSGSSGGGGSATPAPSNDYSSIINNQNSNTQDIINNQNSNTTDIIDNANQNTQDIINSNKVCRFIDKGFVKFDNGYLNSSGVFVSDSSNQWGVTDYINISGATITVQDEMTSGAYTCFYNANKVLTGCSSQTNFTVGSSPFIPSSSVYARFSIYKTLNIPTFNICTNGSQSVDNSIQEVNDTLNNDDIDDNTSFFSGFTNNMHGLSSIITIPLTTIQSLSTTSCVSLDLPIPFTNDTLTLPCMSVIYDTYAHDIYSLWQIVSFGIISYYICIDIFKIVKGFKNPDEDKIEVLDL